MYVPEWLNDTASMVVAALGNGLWQGLVLAGFVWGLLRLIEGRRKLNARTRYVVWCVTLALILSLPVAATRYAGMPSVADDAVVVAVAPPQVTVSALEAPLPPATRETVAMSVPLPVLPDIAATSPEPPVLPKAVIGPSPWQLHLSPLVHQWVPVLFGVWLLMALVLLVRVVKGWLYLRRLKRDSVPLPPKYQLWIDVWCRSHGLNRQVTIAGVDTHISPIAVGLVHPMILVPVYLIDQLTEDEFKQVMLHELAHLQRRDDWTNLFQRLAEALFFFHPAVHWIGRQMEREREMACDDWVVAITRQPRTYASCLARLVELTVHFRTVLAAPGMASGKERLFERVQRLLDKRQNGSARLYKTGLLTILLALFAGFLVMARVAPFFTLRADRFGDDPEQIEVVVEPVKVHVGIPPVPPVPPIPPIPPIPDVPPIPPLPELPPIPPIPDVPPVPPLPPMPSSEPGAFAASVSVNGQTSGQALSVASWIRVLEAAARIPSSGDKTRFLTDAAERLPDDESVFTAYIKTARTVSSSGDRQRALSALVTHHRLGKASLSVLLDAARSIPSDGDKTRLLLQVADVLPDDDALRAAYLDVAETIGSSGNYRQVVSAVK